MKKYSTADRLIQIMKKYNLRQVDILERCIPYCQKYNVRLGRNDLSQYVSGKVEPGQEKLTVLAKALNVSESWLMGLDVPMNNEETAYNIINSRIQSLGITLEQVAEKAEVPLHWLQTIDDFIPGEMDDIENLDEPHELEWDAVIGGYKSYEWISRVAEVLDLPSSALRAALARQEIPAYEGPVLTAEEAFRQAQEDFKDPVEAEDELPENIRAVARDLMELPEENRKLAIDMIKMMSQRGKEAKKK